MGEVDLERLAGAYDHRGGAGVASRARRSAGEAGLDGGSVVVDVGGGRGDAARVFAELGARSLVVDASPSMARRAANHPGVLAVVGEGEALPLAAASADLVFFHLSIHHGDWRKMLGEAWRVLRPGGSVWVWTMAQRHHRASFLAQWFPSVGPIDEQRFPDPEAVAAELSWRGGEVGMVELVDEVRRRAGEWCGAVRAGFVSTLHLLDPDEISRGLAAFEKAHPDPDGEIGYRLLYAGVWSRRPSLVS